MEQSVRAKVLTIQAQERSSQEEPIDAPAADTINRYSIKNKAHYRQEPHDSPDQETVIAGTTEIRKAVSFLVMGPEENNRTFVPNGLIL